MGKEIPLIQIIVMGSEMLHYPNTTAATAMSYYHKHNQVMALKTSHVDISDQIILCSAILFLAGKATEKIRRIREVLNVVRYFYGFESNLLDLKEYQDMKGLIVAQEHFMLRVVAFATTVETPHPFLLNIARYLRLNKQEIKYAWMFLNDSFLDKRVITTSPSVVACACLYLGIKIQKEYSSTKGNGACKNGVNNEDDQWWVKLSINEDILYYTADWITDISLSVSKDGVQSQRII